MSVSSSWVQLHEKRKRPFFYYRKVEIYPRMQWGRPQQPFNVNLSQQPGNPMKCAMAPYGGPIALVHSEKRGGDGDGKKDSKSQLVQSIYVFTSAGVEISNIKFPKDSLEIVEVGWTNDLNLMVLTVDGSVTMYNISMQQVGGPWKAELNTKTKEHVKKSKMFPDGVAIFTSDGNLWVAQDLSQQQPFVKYKVPPNSREWNFLNFEVIPPEYSCTPDTTEIILAPEQSDVRTVYLCTPKQCMDMNLDRTLQLKGFVSAVKLSPSGQYIALFTQQGDLYVIATDFSKNYLKFSTLKAQSEVKEAAKPNQIAWCGDLCVLLYWEGLVDGDDTSLLLMVGCFGDFEKFTFEGPLKICQEPDCARIITNYTCEILQQVCDSTVEIFRIGSLAPSALLYDAYMEYKSKKPASIKTVRQIKKRQFDAKSSEIQQLLKNQDSLEAAARECMEAACREFDVELQQKLLRAAAYGRSFGSHKDEYDQETTNEFLMKCKELRVLNAVRDPQYGVPITYDQFKKLTARCLIDRLALYRHHHLAFSICGFLNISANQVLVDWACIKAKQKIKLSEDPKKAMEQQREFAKETYKIIDQRLREYKPSVSYAQVAMTAFASGNNLLAKMLLNADSRPADQIPLYLKMQETNLAISKAIDSADTDLMYLVILYMKKNFEPQYLYEVIGTRAVARRLFISYCKQEDPETLYKYYEAVGRFREAGNIVLIEAYREDEVDKYIEKLKQASDYLQQDKKYKIDHTLAMEQLELLEIQKELETKFPDCEFIGDSVNETLSECLNRKEEEFAMRLKKTFKIPEKRYWWLKIKALARTQDWEGLEKFSKENKGRSPVGFVPFVEACIEFNADTKEVMKYIPLVKDVYQRVEYYIKFKKFKDAIEAAVAVQNIKLLEYIATKTTNHKTRETIQNVIQQLS